MSDSVYDSVYTPFKDRSFILRLTVRTASRCAQAWPPWTCSRNRISENVDNGWVQQLREQLAQRLSRYDMVKDIRGLGMMSGIIIDATSGDTGISARDQRMRASVLEADKYPEITFSPDHITGQLEADGRFRAKLQGVLALHGDRHEVVLDILGRLAGDKLVASSHFAIPYVDWGMKDPSLLFLKVDRQVNIDIATAGVVVARNLAR